MYRTASARVLSFVLLYSCFCVPGWTQSGEAPKTHKVGLALSGGGARGAAHIGVLKILERERIPIDCIAGTSFGAVVGGLYALGYTASEIEQILTKQEWGNIFSDSPERRLAPLVENRSFRYLAQLNFAGISPELPTGLWSGQKITEVLNSLTLTRMLGTGDDFDRLPIPFRAVATDLLTGEPYVFSHGRMTEAMRASLGIPLVFTPVEKDGMLLVDGGLADNLPTDIVREMGADIIIAVDVTAPLLKKDELHSLVDVMDQSISLLMKQSVDRNRSLASLVIRPDLEGFVSADYLRIREIAARGEKVSESLVSELHGLTEGLPRSGTGSTAAAAPAPMPVIESVSFEGLEKMEGKQIEREIRSKPGKELKPDTLRNDLSRLYATGLFSQVDSELRLGDNGKYRLAYLLKEAPSHTLGASIRYDHDDKFVALVEGTAHRLFGTPSSATISSQFGGIDDDYASLRYVPTGVPFLFIEPKIFLRRRERNDIRGGQLVDRFTDKRLGGQLAIGGTLFKRLEAEIAYKDENATIGGGADPNRLDGAVRLAGLSLRVNRDTLDAPDFPLTGSSFRFQADKRSVELGGDLSNAKYQLDVERYFALSNVSTIVMRWGLAYSRGVLPFFERFYAGGFSYSDTGPRRFLGFDRDELNANQMAILALGYRRQIFNRPLSFTRRGFLDILYNGAALSDRRSSPYDFTFFNGVGVGLSLDTLVGPVRLMSAWGEGSRGKFYISIGPSF